MWGECWEIKDKIGEKKFRGPEILGGGTFGEMPKKGWKNFLAVPKSGGNFLGVSTNFLGREIRNLMKKWGGFSGKLSKKFRGIF